MRLLALFLLLLIMGSMPMTAQRADTLAVPQGLRASLLVASPGQEVYSVYGHAALRLEYPAKRLDYCFTFEMSTDLSTELDFLRGRAKAGFTVAPTPLYLQQYRQAGRGVVAYPLNLTPREIQLLWRNLDQECAAGATWDYDYPGVNCASMCAYMLEKAVGDAGGTLTYERLSPLLRQGSYADVVDAISQHSPWARLFWHVMIIGKDGTDANPTNKMVPATLAESLHHVVIRNGHQRRTVITGQPSRLLPQSLADEPCAFTPTMALALLIVVVVLAVVFVGRRLQKNKKKPNQ